MFWYVLVQVVLTLSAFCIGRRNWRAAKFGDGKLMDEIAKKDFGKTMEEMTGASKEFYAKHREDLSAMCKSSQIILCIDFLCVWLPIAFSIVCIWKFL